MAEVVEDSTQYLTDADRRAIAVYLKSIPGSQDDNTVASADRDTLQKGAAVYIDNCIGCHQRDGSGESGAIPPLRGSSAVQAAKPDTLINVLLQGAATPATHADPSGLAMQAFDQHLSDAQIAQLTTYIRNAWGNRASAVSSDDVHDLRETLRHSP